MFRTAVAAITVLSLVGCGSFFGFKSRASGSYLATKVCGVEIDGKTRRAHLRVVYAVLKPLPQNGALEIEFENPARDAAPLRVTRRLTGSESTIEVVSPAVTALRAREYQVAARVYATAEKREALATQTHACESLVDERDLLR